jgi:hypothetical protein
MANSVNGAVASARLIPTSTTSAAENGMRNGIETSAQSVTAFRAPTAATTGRPKLEKSAQAAPAPMSMTTPIRCASESSGAPPALGLAERSPSATTPAVASAMPPNA